MSSSNHQVFRSQTDQPNARLPRWGSLALVVIAAGVIVLESISFVSDSTTSWQQLLLELAMVLMLPLFALAPVAAAISLAALVFAQAVMLSPGGYLLFAAATIGLVVYACPRWCLWTHVAVITAAGVIANAQAGTLTSLGPFALAFIALVSALIGVGARRAYFRSVELADAASRNETERVQAVAAERERITSELHDILAHDVTLIAMHARVMEAMDDPEVNRESLAVIKGSATRSLADIRRLLNTVRTDELVDDQPLGTDVAAAARTAQVELESIGATVNSRTEGLESLPPAVASTLVRVIREATTNIVRHAGPAPTVTMDIVRQGASVTGLLTNSIGIVDDDLDESTHLGLDRLSARVETLGGELSATADGKRWSLRVVIPLF
ncbi:MAG: sensor histidine kinase [Pseudoclavibacter sp.]